jgi:hypothetical protein
MSPAQASLMATSICHRYALYSIRRKMKNYYITYDNGKREYFDEKGAALRRAAALVKFKKGVVKVYDKHGQFIKSFDGR